MLTSEPAKIAAGAVIVVPFPYSDRHAEKRRPALVVTNDVLAESGLMWVAMITTARRGAQSHDVPIEDLAAAGLTVPCLVRPTKIACLEPSRVVRQAGRLSEHAAEKVFAAVRSFIPAPSQAPD